MSFYRENTVKAVRKARCCHGCGRKIEVGEAALDVAGHWGGDFWSGTFHHECRAAEVAYNRLNNLYGDEWTNLADIEWDDWDWLLEEHPVAAERLGITHEGLAKIKDDWRARWGHRT